MLMFFLMDICTFMWCDNSFSSITSFTSFQMGLFAPS